MSTYLIVLALSLSQSAPAEADSLRIKNDSTLPWSLWFYVESRKAWTNPAMFLARNATVKVNLATPGRYYLVLRDEAKRDEHLGWYDLHKIAKKIDPDSSISLSSVFETLVREETMTVMVPETRTREVIVVENGIRKTKIQEYTVMAPVQKTRTINYTVSKPVFEVQVNGKSVNLREFSDDPVPVMP